MTGSRAALPHENSKEAKAAAAEMVPYICSYARMG